MDVTTKLAASAKAWLADGERMALLSSTAKPDEIDPGDFDAIYFTDGHAVIWDFPDDEGLPRIARDIWEHGGIVSAVCHGYCGLLNTRLSDGTLLVAGNAPPAPPERRSFSQRFKEIAL